MHIVPNTFLSAFSEGEILQVLFVSLLFAVALNMLGPSGKPLVDMIDMTANALFGVVGIIMKAAPIGAFGAMAFTIGKYGLVSLVPLLKMIAVFYLTCVVFVVFVLGATARMAGFSIFKFISYIREELLIVLGTSSSEAALPQVDVKVEGGWMLGIGGRIGGPRRLLVQPRRHLYKPHDDGRVSRPSDEHSARV